MDPMQAQKTRQAVKDSVDGRDTRPTYPVCTMKRAVQEFYLQAKSCRDLACYSATLGPFCFEHANLRKELRGEPTHPAYKAAQHTIRQGTNPKN